MKPVSPTLAVKSGAIAAALILLSACSGGGGSGDPDNNANNTPTNGGDSSTTPDNGSGAAYTSLIVDASSRDAYTYVNLATGQTLSLTAAEAASSTDWHIGFRRTGVVLNGGASGPGQVRGALAVAQQDFYTDSGDPNANVFLNATPDSEEEHLLAAVNTTGLTFTSDSVLSAITASGDRTGNVMDLGWYNYDISTHTVSLNDANGWLLRSNSGASYARFHATSLTYNPSANIDVTFSFDVQPSDAAGFTGNATFAASVPFSGGSQCFDFDADATVDCANAAWDLKLEIKGFNWTLWTNSGPSGSGAGGAFGPLPVADLNNYVSGTQSDTGADISMHYVADATAGIFEGSPWYAYNLQGQHKIWSNYRVYVIETQSGGDDATKYKLQITNYYSDAGASGHPNIRFMPVAN
ncbi:HmuY family protein [Hahella sp. HN01]|uniref:HmuY family protein n=1 Tax=Hahella sp. HN01 TaxID=2847262 RepID=UPI001C1E93D1|nr:HmuY family protein [Hahella sp. HN01]MBU6950116.1 hypothetical protein [Hahella sp. HN01]